MIDLSAMSLTELKTHKKSVEKAIASFEKRQRKEALAAVHAAAAEAGYSLNELLGGEASKKPSRPAKYRDPENPSQTWSGRGRQPAWFKAHIEAGAAPEDLLI